MTVWFTADPHFLHANIIRFAAAIVIDPGEDICLARNKLRPDRQFGPHVVRNHRMALRKGLGGLRREGFRELHLLMSQEAIDAAAITRQKLWTDRREETGPFDIIGDLHGWAAGDSR